MIVHNGVVIHPRQPYRLTVNSFMSSGGDNFSVFTQGVDLVVGAQDLEAVRNYLNPYLPPNPALNPEALGGSRLVKLP